MGATDKLQTMEGATEWLARKHDGYTDLVMPPPIPAGSKVLLVWDSQDRRFYAFPTAAPNAERLTATLPHDHTAEVMNVVAHHWSQTSGG